MAKGISVTCEETNLVSIVIVSIQNTVYLGTGVTWLHQLLLRKYSNAWKPFLRHEAQWTSSDQTEAAKSGDLAPITDCGL